MDAIKKYLEQEKPDFNEGFRLLCRYCRNQSILHFIGRTGSMEHLMYNLKKIAASQPKVNPQAQKYELMYNKQPVAVQQLQDDETSPSNDETSPSNDEQNATEPTQAKADDGEGIDELELADEIISHYKNRYSREQLPEQLQELYDKNTDQYKELRVYHEKMKQCNSDVGRAEFRELVVSLANAIADRWRLIEDKMKELAESNPQQQETIPAARLNSARAYISKMLKKEQLTDEQVLKIKEYYSLLVSAGAEIKEETLQKLRDRGYVS